MATNDSNRQKLDKDILYSAHNIRSPRADGNSPNARKPKPKLCLEDIIPSLDSKPPHQKNPEPAKTPETAAIPRFDLADRIMAKQRKVSAARRTAPPASATMPITPAKPPIKRSTISKNLIYDAIIAEIVARDIAGLCNANNRLVQ